jgi:glycosyltransferase involved in cell wall biosynthesis
LKRLQRPPAVDEPILSVVCAVRNGAHCIEGLLDSWRRERTSEVQLVVLDGASTDATWSVLERHADLIDLAVSEADAGIYDAWNKALVHCRGRYVAFIGADDRLAGGSIRTLVDICRSEDAHVVAGFNVLTRRAVPVRLLGEPFDTKRLHSRMLIAHVMSAHRLDWLRSAGGFDASFRSSGDYELLLRQRHTLRVRVINEVLAYMEDGGASRTSLRPFTENFRARRGNGYPLWQCSVLFAKAMAGIAWRRVTGRR